MIYIDDISNKIYIDPLFPHKWRKRSHRLTCRSWLPWVCKVKNPWFHS